MKKTLLLMALALVGILRATACGPVEDITGTGDETTPVALDADGNPIITTALVWDTGNWDENNWQAAPDATTN